MYNNTQPYKRLQKLVFRHGVKEETILSDYCDQKDIIFNMICDSFKLQKNKNKKLCICEQRIKVKYLSFSFIDVFFLPQKI